MNEMQQAMDQFMTALTEKMKRDMEQQADGRTSARSIRT